MPTGRIPEPVGIDPISRIAAMQTGRCQCGEIRYACAERPLELYVCHCTECRRQSASAHGISYIVRRADFRLVNGHPEFWVRGADSGRTVECAFCPRCGTRLWHQSSTTSETVSVKGGTLDAPVDITGAIHIWTVSKLPGVVIPAGARQFPGEPD